MGLKNIFMLALVGGAIYYSYEYTNLLDGWLFSPRINIDFSEFPPDFEEGDLKERFSGLDWDCRKERSNLGHRSCLADIRSWNGICSEFVAFIFNSRDRVKAIKVAIPSECYKELKPALDEEYGESGDIPRNPGQTIRAVVWRAGNGLLITTKRPEVDRDNTVLWISGNGMFDIMLQRYISGGK